MEKQIVRLALCHQASMLPIQKSDLLKLFDNRRDFPDTLDRARQILRRLFGLDLIDPWTARDDNPASENDKPAGKQVYYLVSTISSITTAPIKSSTDGSMAGLRMLILAFIYLNYGKVSDSSLQKYLVRFGFTESPDGRHFLSNEHGKLKDVMDTMCKQHYLACDKVDDKSEWRWGQRAMVEVTRDQLISFMLRVQQLDTDDSELRRLLKKSGRREYRPVQLATE